jgi:hypothetical protein
MIRHDNKVRFGTGRRTKHEALRNTQRVAVLVSRANKKLEALGPGGVANTVATVLPAEPQGCGLLGIPDRARPCGLRTACGAVHSDWVRGAGQGPALAVVQSASGFSERQDGDATSRFR